jgi:hypothetical protein
METMESAGFSARRVMEMKQSSQSIDIKTVITKAVNGSLSISGEQLRCHPSGNQL